MRAAAAAASVPACPPPMITTSKVEIDLAPKNFFVSFSLDIILSRHEILTNSRYELHKKMFYFAEEYSLIQQL